MAKIKNVESLCERELLEKILHTVEKHEKALAQHQMPQNHLYDNKALMAKLGIKEKYLKKLRDNGYLGYSRQGDKYSKTRPISDGFRKNNVNYWAFREIRSIIPHL